MAGYSIRDLERLSGIKAHTIRMWEKRYGIIEPKRTSTNIRYYTNEELKKILNIAILNNNGLKISKIVQMPLDKLHQKVVEIASHEIREDIQIESLVLAMIDLDETRMEKILSSCIIRLGFEKTMLSVIYPFFQKVGILWQTGSIIPAQEHFISNLIRQKLIVAIDGQSLKDNKNAKKFLLFLPENEFHELGLLFYAFLIKKNGHKLIYLGQSVPLHDLVDISERLQPDYLCTSFLGMTSCQLMNSYLDDLLKIIPGVPIILCNRIADTSQLVQSKRLVFNLHPEEFRKKFALES